MMKAEGTTVMRKGGTIDMSVAAVRSLFATFLSEDLII